MLKLAPAAAAMIGGDGFLEVNDQQTAQVARRLLDSGVANPRPSCFPPWTMSPSSSPPATTVRDSNGCSAALRGHHVIVVDDGSESPIDISAFTGGSGRISVLRQEISRGPAAARNVGMRSATTEFVAFLDSDVVPRAGWLEVMLGHFSDPSVVLVAPRIVALDIESNDLARYEHSRSSLDLGPREAAVRARSVVSYVPSAAILARRRVLLDEGGFDETMRVAEDVDLCWRLEESGWRLRYEPAAHVAHDHRVTFRHWFTRKMYLRHGRSSARRAPRPRGGAVVGIALDHRGRCAARHADQVGCVRSARRDGNDGVPAAPDVRRSWTNRPVSRRSTPPVGSGPGCGNSPPQHVGTTGR